MEREGILSSLLNIRTLCLNILLSLEGIYKLLEIQDTFKIGGFIAYTEVNLSKLRKTLQEYWKIDHLFGGSELTLVTNIVTSTGTVSSVIDRGTHTLWSFFTGESDSPLESLKNVDWCSIIAFPEKKQEIQNFMSDIQFLLRTCEATLKKKHENGVIHLPQATLDLLGKSNTSGGSL